MTASPAPQESRFALRFFAVAATVFCGAGLLAWALVSATAPAVTGERAYFPGAFWLSTALLIAGSVLLQRAHFNVQVERQQPFRRALLSALAVGALFVGVQSYGLWALVRNVDPAEGIAGVNIFLFMLAGLHGLHFSVALLFLVFVSLKGLAGRYDHEYYWGVTVCAFFWHVLGAAWLAILGVFLTAS